MPTCSAPGCRSGYASEENTCDRRHFFKPPNDPAVLKAWTAAIPRKAFQVTVKTYICDLHFESEDIISCYEHIVGGNVVKIPRGRWTLKPGAVPRIFPNSCTLVQTSGIKAQRKPPKLRGTANFERPVSASGGDVSDVHMDNSDVDEATGVPSDPELCPEVATWFPALQDRTKFQSWNVELIQAEVVQNKGIVEIDKALVVTKDFTVVLSSWGKLVPPCAYSEHGLGSQLKLTSLQMVSAFLSYVDRLKICTGCHSSLFPSISTATSALKIRDVWGSTKCFGLSREDLCPPCKSTRKNLRAREMKKKGDIYETNEASPKITFDY
ncbi:uncharacterized protein LOC119382163 [Rhipicephalus sanguineus]|uniref:uncharacterized protein LOC119382163 n=1 Tax=Rhipicephalus sanguineus TaxID=34632 RepID=UPI001892E695|nr:uncharacterized protein LOC119382163 [Rhipicephalus sanguineus]